MFFKRRGDGDQFIAGFDQDQVVMCKLNTMDSQTQLEELSSLDLKEKLKPFNGKILSLQGCQEEKHVYVHTLKSIFKIEIHEQTLELKIEMTYDATECERGRL